MTTAVVFATEPVAGARQRPAALLELGGESLLNRLSRQLIELEVDRVIVITRPEFEEQIRSVQREVITSSDVTGDLSLLATMAASGEEPLLLCTGDLIAHTSALAFALRVEPTVALTGPRRRLDLHPLLLQQRSRAISVASAFHSVTAPNAAFRGVLKVASADLPALVAACEAMPEAENWAGPTGAAGLVLLAMVRGGTMVKARKVRLLVCTRVDDPNGVRRAGTELSGIDEEATRLRLAVKEHDDLFATYCVSSFSPRIVRWVAKLGLSPTMVTWISVLFVLGAAGCFAFGGRTVMAVGAALLYIGFVFDCVDGQLARYTLNFSRFGGWLDTIADRAKEYTVYAGLAFGATREGILHVWPLAAAVMTLQTVRHMTDVWYGALQDQAVGQLPRQPLTNPADRLAARANAGHGQLANRVGLALGRASARMESDRGSFAYWLKRTIVFPIGERWVLLAVTATVFNGQVALYALLAWGTIAFFYTIAGRTLRARAMRVSVLPAYDRTLQRDDGLISHVLGLIGRGWAPPLVVALLGALPVIVILLIGAPHIPPVVNVAHERWVVGAVAVALLAGLGAGRPHDGPLDWLVPAILRAAECSIILLAGINDAVPWPLTFALLGVVAAFHYDLAARVDKCTSPLGGRWLALGWDVRLTLIGLLAVFDETSTGIAILTGYLALVFIIGSLIGLFRSGRPRRPLEAVATTPAATMARQAIDRRTSLAR